MNTVMELHEAETQERVRPEISHKPDTPIFEPPLFADVLLEADSTEKRRRGWSTVSSAILQCLILGIVVIVPLMFTDALPKQQLLTFLVAPPPPPPPPPPAAPAPMVRVRMINTELMNGHLQSPSRIPQTVQMIKEDEAPPPLSSGGGVIGGVPGGIPGGQLGGVIGGIISSTPTASSVPKLAVAPPKRVLISQGVIKGYLLERVEPTYPALAKSAHIQGMVELSAFISKTGAIENLEVVSGHPMLVPAAIDAVKQWRYRPFMLNGIPVEVETRITVTFQFLN